MSMILHSAFFFLFSLLTGLFGALLLAEDSPLDKWILLFAFLVASLFAAFAAKNLLEVLAR